LRRLKFVEEGGNYLDKEKEEVFNQFLGRGKAIVTHNDNIRKYQTKEQAEYVRQKKIYDEKMKEYENSMKH
jgi:hypothetical protein